MSNHSSYETVTIETCCPLCGKGSLVTLSKEDFDRLNSDFGQTHTIQEVLPNIPALERELLKTGICQSCFPK